MAIFFTSDLHFNHNKEFVWKERGFSSIEEMNQEIIKRWNSIVLPSDIVYILGDLMLGDNESGIKLINQLNGYKHIIIGNHDTETRIKLYQEQIDKLCSIKYADQIKYGKIYLYLSHYPTITSNYDDQLVWAKHLVNLYGHTHQKDKFYSDNPYMYNVGMEAHNCTPVSIEEIEKDIIEKQEIIKDSIGGQPWFF